MIYALCDMNEREVVGLRYASEQEAILLAHQSISQEQKDRLWYHLEKLESVKDPIEQTVHDQMIHSTIVEASNNRLVIAQYTALNKLLNVLIHKVRDTIAGMGEQEYKGLQASHRDLVVNLCNDNYQGAKEALDDHFYYMLKVIEEEELTGGLPSEVE